MDISILSPLALSRVGCQWCHGAGVVVMRYNRERVCACVVRRMEVERASLPSDWERLWLDARRRPWHFPPTPLKVSSWWRWV